jgi:PPM family protein phosphatase
VSSSETESSRIDPPAQPGSCQHTSVRSFGRTDPGRVRTSNEDHFLIAELARTMWVHQTSLPQPETQYGNHRAHVFLVADGMGGHNAGEIASALTVASIESFILNMLRRFSNLQATEEENAAREFQTALEQAHARIFQETARHPEFSGMGTTLTMAFASNWKLFVVHAGDSRCYLFRGGELKQMTTDHTVVGELLRRGVIEPREAAHHRYRHVVTNAVGGTAAQIQAEVHKTDLRPEDVVLLCTDGLTDMLSDARIAEILLMEYEPQAACDGLVAAANEQGGKDNITAVVVGFRKI